MLQFCCKMCDLCESLTTIGPCRSGTVCSKLPQTATTWQKKNFLMYTVEITLSYSFRVKRVMYFLLLFTSINYTAESTMFYIPRGRRIIYFLLLFISIYYIVTPTIFYILI